jgi:hypothetical protein
MTGACVAAAGLAAASGAAAGGAADAAAAARGVGGALSDFAAHPVKTNATTPRRDSCVLKV